MFRNLVASLPRDWWFVSKFNAAFIVMSAVSFVFVAYVFTKNILSESTESLSGSQPNGTKGFPNGKGRQCRDRSASSCGAAGTRFSVGMVFT